jgi:outer membrane protein TolC
MQTLLQNMGTEMTGIRKDQYKIALDINQTIWDGGTSKAQKEIAKANAKEAQNQVDVTLYDLQQRVDNLYFGILLLDERYAQTKALISVLKSNLDRIKAYHKNGVAMQSDIDAVEAELLSAEQTMGQVEASRNSYRRMLEAFIGKKLTEEKLIRPEATEIINRTSARPELALFDAQIGKIEAQRKSIKNLGTPRFSAFAQGFYGYPGYDIFKNMTSADWSLNGIIGIRMQWNLTPFYTQKNNLDMLNVAQNQIEVQRETFLFNTQMQTTQDDGEIARLRKAITNDSRIVELRSSVRKAAESKMENGVIDATELLQKITEETNASLTKSTHEIELLQAIYRLKHTLNQ